MRDPLGAYIDWVDSQADNNVTLGVVLMMIPVLAIGISLGLAIVLLAAVA